MASYLSKRPNGAAVDALLDNIDYGNLAEKTSPTDNDLLPIFDSVTSGPKKIKFSSVALGGSKKNLLHNWDFRHPVNQRGQSSYSGIGYGIDRWKAGNANVTINAGVSITVTDTATDNGLGQNLEYYSQYKNKTLTFSVNIIGGTGVNGGAYLTLYDGVTATTKLVTSTGIVSITKTISSSVSELAVAIIPSGATSGRTLEIESAKLELGTVSTLANDPPADFGEQLALCRRYLRDLAGVYRMAFYNAGSVVFSGESAFAGMRTLTPTLVAGAETTAWNVYTTTGSVVTGFTLTFAALYTLQAWKSSHGLTDATLFVLPNKVFASADL